MHSIQSQGKICVLDLDLQGVKNAKISSIDPNYLFIAPPSMAHLTSRLRMKGIDSEADIEKRLENAAQEIIHGKSVGNFDKFLVNDELESSFFNLCENVQVWYPHLLDQIDVGSGSTIYQFSSSSSCIMNHCTIS